MAGSQAPAFLLSPSKSPAARFKVPSRKIYLAMKAETTIASKEAASQLTDCMNNIAELLAGSEELQQMARWLYYRVNTFGVVSKTDCKTIAKDVQGGWKPRILSDDPLQRPHIRNLELYVTTSDGLRSSREQGEDIRILQQLPDLYPRLRSLTLVVENITLTAKKQNCRPIGKTIDVIRGERFEAFEGFVHELRALPGLWLKYVTMKQQELGSETNGPSLMEIDGREREVKELRSELLDRELVSVRI